MSRYRNLLLFSLVIASFALLFASCTATSDNAGTTATSSVTPPATHGKMRGVGWAICNQNPANGRLSNHWITLHETGNVAGFHPVLVMDVWEHAYLLDYKPAERPKYIEAFFSNIDWTMVEKRLQKDAGVRSVGA